MTPYDEFIRDTYWLMQAILKEALAVPGEIEFTLIENKNAPPLTTQRNILRALEDWHAFKLQPKVFSSENPPMVFRLNIKQKRFEELLYLFENGTKLNMAGDDLYELAHRYVRPSSDNDPRRLEAWEVMHRIKKDMPVAPESKKDTDSNSLRATFEIPPDTQWSAIVIKFENKFDIEILLKGKHLASSNADELGFIKTATKAKTVDKQWQLLQYLSVIYYAKNKQGEMMVEPTIENLARSLKVSKDAVMKTKEKLSKHLQKIFSISGDPFESYADAGYYQTKFTLTPEPDLRREEVWESGLPYNDNIKHSYLDDDLEKLPE
jgi:hypothetical protein